MDLSDGHYADQEDRLGKVYSRLMMVDPLFYELLLSLKLYLSKSIGGIIDNPTACTFSDVIVVNPDFMDELNDIELLSVLDHEVNHIIRGDTSFNNKEVPKGLKDFKNAAMDYVINYRIVKERYYCSTGTRNREKYKASFPKGCCFNEKYDNKWNWEMVYQDLIKNNDIKFVFVDKHLTQEELDSLKSAGVTVEEINQGDITGKLFNAIEKAKSMAGFGAVPDYMRDLLTDLTEPQFDYYELLYGIVENQKQDDVTWVNPRRKYLDMGYYLPDKGNGLTFRAGMFFDVSGSIGAEEIQKFSSEYFGLINQLSSFELHLGCFSSSVHEDTYKVFTKDDYEAEEYQFNGSGGTDLSCITNFLKKKNVQLDNLIVLTDGETLNWPDGDYCNNLIILCTTNIESPVGRTYHIDL